MKLTVDISLYPLREQFIAPIHEVIEGFKAEPGVEVETGPTSTLLCGDYDAVMSALQNQMRRSFEQYGHCVFVARFIGRDVREPWDKTKAGG
ncbi:MAG: thiamine-binding protein [Cellvibrionaceae bacterium]|nr:thiamine-binding protein [Cellvibrionaceae bacterium]MCV6626109.1 thiamine-binding protein [Cellvibrionaceae bacterium]